MHLRTLGTSGIKTSVVGIGTWAIGGWMWGGTDEKNAIEGIKAGMDAGCNLIDTAPAYGLGLSEKIVGKAIQGKRDQVVLATKCGLVWHVQKGNYIIDQNGKPIHRYLGAESIRYEVEQSLKRLNTDYIDLYQTHWQDPTTPISETMSTLLELKKEGKIRAIGVSNIKLDELKQYLELGPVDSAQEKYHMLERSLEDELLPFCRENNISILAYSPLCLGLLTGKVGPDREFPEDDLRSNNPLFSKENREKVLQMLETMKPLAEKHDLTYAQLVIAWTLAQPGITYALVGARNAKQAQENAKAGSVLLEQDDLDTLNGIVKEHTAAME